MRADLNMRKGKMVAQGAHASMAFLSLAYKRQEILYKDAYDWINGSFAKICVKVDSLEELMEIYKKAKEANLECHLITDNGDTEFNGVPTVTCVGIGPHKSSEINPITGHLKLL